MPPAAPARRNDFADRAVQLADLAGFDLDEWQRYVLRSMLARAPGDAHWAAYESCLLVPRQNGKSLLLEAYGLAKLFLTDPGPSGHLILHTAHLFPTAMESFRHLTAMVRNCPELMAEVERIPLAHGEEGIYLRNGSRLRFAARTVTGAGRGFSPDDVIFDEAYRLPETVLSALMPALSAKPDPQLVYAASAGYPESEQLWSLVERGRAGGDPTLAYFEWSTDRDTDLDDVSGWAESNPAFGIRLSERKTLAERASMSDDDFARERLGMWADTAEEAVIPEAVWRARAGAVGRPAGPVAFALSAAWPDAEMGSIAVAGWNGDEVYGQITQDDFGVLDYRPGTSWMPARMKELQDKHRPVAVLLDDKDPAACEKAALERAGVELTSINMTQASQAFGAFISAVAGDAPYLRHYDQPELNAAVAAAQKRKLGDAHTWARQGPTDVSPVVALTDALHGLLTCADQPFFAAWR